MRAGPGGQRRGYPDLSAVVVDGNSGLRALLAQVDPDLLTRMGRWAGFLSQSEVNDSVVRAVVAPRQQKMNQGSVYTDYGGQIERRCPTSSRAAPATWE